MADDTTFEGGVPMTDEGLVASNPNAIWTVSDMMVEPLDMTPEMVKVTDIAHALSQACRFTGHTREFFSVAQHSANVSKLVVRRMSWDNGFDWGVALYALLHDATEAYLSDMARPLKHYNEFGDAYRKIEARLMWAIAEAHDLDPEMPEVVKWADDVALRVECRDLMGPTMKAMYADGNEDVAMYFPEPMRAWSPREAERTFLDTYTQITELREGGLVT